MRRRAVFWSRAVLVVALVTAASAVAAFEFQPYGRGSFAELRKAHAGKPLVVHFWSVTCAPCLAELPDWARVAHTKNSFDLLFVNADHEGDRARARMRLEKAGLQGATHYAFADDFVERLYFEADSAWRGELPFTALISAEGRLVTIIGAIDDPEIAKWIGGAERK